MASIITTPVYKLPPGYPKVPSWVTEDVKGMEKEIAEWLEENDKKQRIAAQTGARTTNKRQELPSRKVTVIEVQVQNRQEDIFKRLVNHDRNKPTIPKRQELAKKKVSFSNIVNLKCISCGAKTNQERKFGKCACKEWKAEVTTTKTPVTEDDSKSKSRKILTKVETQQKVQMKKKVRTVTKEEIERSFKNLRRNITPKIELSKKLQKPALSPSSPLRFSGPVSLDFGKETKFFPNGVMVMPLQG